MTDTGTQRYIWNRFVVLDRERGRIDYLYGSHCYLSPIFFFCCLHRERDNPHTHTHTPMKCGQISIWWSILWSNCSWRPYSPWFAFTAVLPFFNNGRSADDLTFPIVTFPPPSYWPVIYYSNPIEYKQRNNQKRKMEFLFLVPSFWVSLEGGWKFHAPFLRWINQPARRSLAKRLERTGSRKAISPI